MFNVIYEWTHSVEYFYLPSYHMKAHQMFITMMQTVYKSDDKKLRYSKIGSEITNMLEDASQHIACDFDTSQGVQHRNVWLGLKAAEGRPPNGRQSTRPCYSHTGTDTAPT